MNEINLVLVRHGESIWNKENRFTGWQDVELSEKGIIEAQLAGQELKKQNIKFDICMTSVLTRALETQWSILRELNLLWIETIKSWRLNERHYGELTGLNKSEMAKIHGEEQVKIWRRSFAVPPPPMKRNDPRDSKLDPRYSKVPEHEIPLGESLLNTVERVIPFWDKEMKPRLIRGEKILLVAHGNSIRALIYHLELMTPEQILEINIPTATPIAYSLDNKLKVIEKKMLGDPETIKKEMSRVLAQGKAD